MDIFDLFSLVLIAVFFGFGRKRGLAWQVAGIASLVLGYVAATRFAPGLCVRFKLDTAPGRFFVWAGVYSAVSTAVYLVACRFKRFLRDQELDELDQHLGGVLGAVKGAILLSLFVIVIVTLIPRLRPRILGSRTGRAVTRMVEQLRDTLPPETVEAVRPWIDSLRRPVGEPGGTSQPGASGGGLLPAVRPGPGGLTRPVESPGPGPRRTPSRQPPRPPSRTPSPWPGAQRRVTSPIAPGTPAPGVTPAPRRLTPTGRRSPAPEPRTPAPGTPSTTPRSR